MPVNFLNNVVLPDNAKLAFGNSWDGTNADLEIYHDGSNSYIVDAGAGDLLTYYSNDFKVIQYGSSEVSIWARANEYVKLFYDGNEKLATTNTGISITGGFTTTSSSDCAGLNMTADIAMGDYNITDVNASAGSAGQVLSSLGAGNGVDWVDATTGDITGVTAGNYLNGGGTSGTVTVNHDTTSRSDTTSSASPGSAGTFTCLDSVTTGTYGHVTAANLKTVTMPTVPTVAGVYLPLTGGTLTGDLTITDSTLTISQTSTTDPVLTLNDDGVANYNFTFPDTSTIQLSTDTTSTKVFKVTNAGSGKFNLDVEGTATINTIDAVGSDTDKFLMSDSGEIKYVTGANLRSYIGAGTGSGTVTSVAATAGTGISISGSPITSSGTLTITNTAPETFSEWIIRDDDGDDKTLSGSTNKYLKFEAATGTLGTNLSGTGTTADPYVMTITSPDSDSGGTVTSVTLAAGTGISLSGTNPITSSGTITITNTAPQTTTGTVTSVDATTDGDALSTSNTVTSSGTLTLPWQGSSSQYVNGEGNLTNLSTLPQGTVTSVGVTAGTGISVSGSPVTGSGSITVTNSAPAYGWVIRDDDGDDKTLSGNTNKYLQVTMADGTAGTNLSGTGNSRSLCISINFTRGFWWYCNKCSCNSRNRIRCIRFSYNR